jgi:hypothetical protein
MQALIDGLLDYSRVAESRGPTGRADCEAALSLALGNLRLAIEESGAVVTRDPLPTVLGDQLQLAQVFQNLIDNAVKFRGREPPSIHIGAHHGDTEVTFRVCDNGIGIEPAHAERIFLMFQRLHPRSAYPGTGIGLALSKKIIEQSGGRMWVESRLGAGATFFFTLPWQESSPVTCPRPLAAS